MKIQADNGSAFNLLKDKMLERGPDFLHWFAWRSTVKQALDEDALYMKVGLATIIKGVFCELLHHYGSNDFSFVQATEGATEHNRKYLRIGCMRFTGRERVKLIRWTRGYAR